MVHSNDIRRAFVSRLKQALSHAGIPEWGAGARLAEMTGKTAKAASKWWNEESMPARISMVAIARELGVRVEWLQYGEGEMLALTDAEAPARRAAIKAASEVESRSNVEPGPETKGLIPLISWVQAGAWSEAVDLYAVGDAEDWLPCPANHGPRCFALKVRGESMFDPHGRRSFREGDIVYVDPDRQAENGSLVIAKLTDSQEATFKQLVIEDEKRYLKALNPSWPERMMPINGSCHIVGVVFTKVEMF